MAFSLLAQGRVKDIFELDPEILVRSGVKVLLADLDNTLTPYSSQVPTQAVREWKQALEAHGITLFVVSNSRKATRVPTYCDDLGIDYVRHAGKPGTSGFRKALERLGCAPEEALMVGDQIFTDVLGANRAGVPVVLVEPIQLAGNPGRYLRYAVELPFRLGVPKGWRA